MQSTENYRIDLEICPTPILLVAYDGAIVRSNSRLDELFGYEKGELVGQVIEVLVPTAIRPHHPELRVAFTEVPTTRRMGTGRDLYGLHKNGDLLPVEIGLDPIELNGTALIMVSVIDIRERKRSEAMMRSALNAASSAMIQVNASGKIELVNDRTLDLFGYEAQELIGNPIEILVPDRFQRKHPVYRTSYENNRDTRKMGSGRDLFGLHKNGREIPIEIGLTPVHGSASRSTMATIIDVTDRKAKERQIEAKNDQLKRLNEELLQFAYSASHDLKAPLASIAGLTSLCALDIESGNIDEVRENLTKIDNLSERLRNRIEEMLSLAKSDMGSGDWSSVELGSIIDQVWRGVGTPEVSFITEYDHPEPVRSVKARLEVILENLLSNAVKYRNQESTDSIIRVKTWTDAERVHLSVADNGIGIAPEHHDRVFNLFQRVSKGDQSGNGLGLALVRKNVVQLGGEISLSSVAGETVFTLALPQYEVNN
ncbi:MAG: sensor histidine kinase [Burkholderiaceae bacterium]